MGKKSHLLFGLSFWLTLSATPSVSLSHADCITSFTPKLSSPYSAQNSPLLSEITPTPTDAWLLRPRGVSPEISALSQITEQSSALARWEIIRDFPIGSITAKPGHQILRDASKIEYFKTSDPGLNTHYTKTDSMGVFRDDPSVINVITDPSGKIVDIDLWDGHHRFLGAMAAGKKKLSELNESNISILVNGVDVHGVQLESKPPASGVDFSRSKQWQPNSKGVAFTPRNNIHHDVLVSGRISNRELGSVYTLADILESNLRRPPMRVGVVLDPSKTLVPASLKNIDVLLIIGKPSSVPAMSAHSIPVFYYTGHAHDYIQKFTQESFLKRVQQIFVTPALPTVL